MKSKTKRETDQLGVLRGELMVLEYAAEQRAQLLERMKYDELAAARRFAELRQRLTPARAE